MSKPVVDRHGHEAPSAMENEERIALEAWQARHEAHLADVGAEAGFDPVEDHASLVVRFFAAMSDRYSPDRQDRVLGPIIKSAEKRYGELLGRDYRFAVKVSNTEAVRAIMALKLAQRA